MKKFLTIFLLILCLCANSAIVTASADSGEGQDVNSLIDKLDLSAIIDYFNSLEPDEQMFFGYSVVDYIKSVASGEASFDIEDLLNLSFSEIAPQIGDMLSFAGLLISICIILSLMSEICIKRTSNSIKNAANLAGLITISGIVIYKIYGIISSVSSYVSELKLLIDSFFPIFYTLFTAIGASSTVNVISPTITFFSSIIVFLIDSVVVPLTIIALILSIVGNFSESVSLNNLHKTLCDFSKWIIRTTFFVLATFLVIRGVSSGVTDGISLRVTKFALGKYVPIIGGYLSDGFNYVIAGSIAIKNAVGITVFVLLAIKFIPVYFSVILTSFVFKFANAIAEPLGVDNFCRVFSKINDCLSVLCAIAVGVTFTCLIFIAGVIMSGNVVL